MNIRQIKTLFSINLRYANPQITNQRRKRGKVGSALTKSLLIQYSLSGLIFLAIFTIMMLVIDFPRYPGYFSLYFGLYLMFAGSQAFASLHNVMYESTDLKDLLPLPVTNNSIFFAKFLTVAFTVIPYALPLLALFLMTGLRASGFIGFFLAIIVFVLVTLLLLAISAWLISLIVQTKIFQRFKKTANAILLILPVVGSMGAYFYLVFQNSRYSDLATNGGLVDRPSIPVFIPTFDALVHPFSLGSLTFWAIGLITLGAFYLVIQKQIIPKMFELQLSESPVKSKKNSKSRSTQPTQSLSHQLFQYNLGLIKNPTLWMQMLTSSYIMPFALMMTGQRYNLSQVSIRFFAAFVLAGAFFAFLTTNTASLVSLIISLDRENFSYIKSLPISLISYLRSKFYFALGLQTLMNSVILLIISFVLRVSPLLILAILIGNLLALYIYGQYYYYRDFRLLNLTWTNVSQLYSRGGGSWLMLGLFFGAMIGGGVIVALAAVSLIFLPLPWLVNVVIIAIMLLIFWLIDQHYQKVFWKNDKIH